MKIYIATDGEYSDYHIKAVFTDYEKAKIYCAIHKCNLETYKDHSDEIEDTGRKVLYKYKVGRTNRIYVYERYEFEGCKNHIETASLDIAPFLGIYGIDYSTDKDPSNRDKCSWAIVYLPKRNKALATKIGRDMLAKYDAELLGL